MSRKVDELAKELARWKFDHSNRWVEDDSKKEATTIVGMLSILSPSEARRIVRQIRELHTFGETDEFTDGYELTEEEAIAEIRTLAAREEPQSQEARWDENQIFVKLLDVRDALLRNNIDEAYHELYSIADPTFTKHNPWDKWEALRESRQPAPEAKKETIVHGVNCPKAEHKYPPGGYLHGELDDSPFDDDGVKYCGRCHHAL